MQLPPKYLPKSIVQYIIIVEAKGKKEKASSYLHVLSSEATRLAKSNSQVRSQSAAT